MRLRLWGAVAACLLVGLAAHAEPFDEFVLGQPPATSTLGATDAMPVIQGGETRQLFPQSYFMRPDGTNATLPAARTAILPTPTLDNCMVGNGEDWTSASCPGPGGMLQGASNATLPAARDNINANGNMSFRTPADFGAKCDVAYPTGFTIGAASNVLTATATTFTVADIGKKVLLPGQTATGGVLHTSITGVSAGNALLADNAVPGTTKMFTTSALYATRGTGYVPTNTITVAGGTGTVATVVTVETTAIAATPGIVAAGSGGTNGAQQIYGTTGNGHRFVLNVTITAGALASIQSIADAGHYGTNPTSLAAEPVAGAGLTGATVSLAMGVDHVQVTTPGIYTNGLFPASPASQASTSGSGTGATFTLLEAYNSQMMVYGTDDTAAFNTALALSGVNIQMPDKPCGIFSTLSMPGNRTWLMGQGHQGSLDYGVAPTGSTLQWLGADGGTMFNVEPPGVPQGFYNRVSGITFQCGIPNNVGSSPHHLQVAGIGLRLRSQEAGEFDHLSFNECSGYNIYASANEVSGNFQHSDIHHIYMQNGLFNSGIGIFLSVAATGNDSDYYRVREIFSVYNGKPAIKVGSLDNGKISQVHFWQRPDGVPGVYGLDITGKVYGETAGDNNTTLLLEQISSTSIARGLESSALPPSAIIITGFDTGNSIPKIVERPGGGLVSYIDYDGVMKIAGSLTAGGALTGVGAGTIKGASATSFSIIEARRNDYDTSFANTYLLQYGASAAGTTDTLSNANLGLLAIQNTTNALIRTNGASRLYFSTEATLRGYFGNTADGGGLVLTAGLTAGGAITGAQSISAIGTGGTNYAILSNLSGAPGYGGLGFSATPGGLLSTDNYAVLSDLGNTFFNVPSGGLGYFRVNNVTYGYWTPGRFQFGNDGAGVPVHVSSGQATAPALTSCGTSPAIVGTDTAGKVTMGTTATGCVITFNVAYAAEPHCVVTWQATPLASQSYSVAAGAITLTQTSASGNIVNYVCIGRSGG